MPWTTVTNVSTGDVLTASNFNNQVLSNLTALRGDYARSVYTGADLTITSTTWTNLGGPADLVLAALTGDLIEVAFSGIWGTENTIKYLDVVTVVGGSPVNAVSNASTPDNGQSGVTGWRGDGTTVRAISGSFFYTLVAGDISSSTVTLRLRTRVSGSTTMFAGTTNRQTFFARNHGPVEI